VVRIAEKLVNKRMVDVDALMKYLSDWMYFGEHHAKDVEESLYERTEEFISTVVPDVEVGQHVFVITDGKWDSTTQSHPKEVIECVVHRKTIKTKYTFSVRGHNHGNYYNGNFTLSSIGKTVFFTEEDAKKALEKEK
jgi:hypothetical protein